jgi:hypothetical protein
MAEAPAKDAMPIIAHAAGPEKVDLGGSSTGKEAMAADVAGISKWENRQIVCLILTIYKRKSPTRYLPP